MLIALLLLLLLLLLLSEWKFYVEIRVKYKYFVSSCQLCSNIFVIIAIKPDDLHGLLLSI
jgi:hypothetical protein